MLLKGKRISSITLAILMASSVTVLADVPEKTVVIGNRAYDFEYVNDVSNLKEISEALAENDEIFVKLPNGKWVDNKTENIVDKKIIPKLTYRAADGHLEYYMARDGEEIEFGIERAAFVNDHEFNIKFNMGIDSKENLKDLVKIGDKKLGEKDKVEVLKDGQTLAIKLFEKLKAGNSLIKIQLDKDICNKDGLFLKEKYEKEILVVNSINEKLEEKINTDINIVRDNVNFRNINVDGDIYVYGKNVSMFKCKINGNLTLDPGAKGSANINQTEAKNSIILSGGENSIYLNACKFNSLLLNSSDKTRVKATGKSEIKETKVMSKGILDSYNNGFGKVKIEAPNNEIVQLKGTFDEVEVLSCGTVKAERGAKIKNLILNSFDAVTLDGTFDKVTINCEAEAVNLAPKTKIKVLVVNAETKINGDSSVKIGKIETENENVSVEEIKGKISEEVKTGVEIKDPIISGGSFGGGAFAVSNKINKNLEKDDVKLSIKGKKIDNEARLTFEVEVCKPEGINNLQNYTITICDSNDRIIYQGQDNIVDNKFKFTTTMKTGKHKIEINIPGHKEKIEFSVNW